MMNFLKNTIELINLRINQSPDNKRIYGKISKTEVHDLRVELFSWLDEKKYTRLIHASPVSSLEYHFGIYEDEYMTTFIYIQIVKSGFIKVQLWYENNTDVEISLPENDDGFINISIYHSEWEIKCGIYHMLKNLLMPRLEMILNEEILTQTYVVDEESTHNLLKLCRLKV